VPNPRVCLVTSRKDWAAECVRALGGQGLWAEVIGWDSAHRIEPPVAAIAPHLDGELSGPLPSLAVWAERALQPCTALFLAPFRRSALVVGELRRLGFARIRTLPDGTCSPEELKRALVQVVDRGLWVAGAFAREVGNTEPLVVRVYTAALDGPTPARTSAEWAKLCWKDPYLRSESGICERHALARFFRQRGLPPSKRALDAMRLCCVCDHAQRNAQPTRAVLMRRFGYASADALGRFAKRLTGRPLGDVRRLPPKELLAHLVHRLPK